MNMREKARRLVELDGKASNESAKLRPEEWSELSRLTHSFSMVPEYARKLIEAEKILIEMDRYLDFSTPYDDGVCETCGNGFPDASGINQAMQDAREFLNSLEREDEQS